MKSVFYLSVIVSLLVSGCAVTQRAVPSASQLSTVQARVITDNDAAFLSKLQLVEQATISIDLMYYIYSDDYSSSTLSKALIDAARRGVKVRLLVDYNTNYKNLDLYSLLEKEGAGNLQVHLYNRPTKNIVENAVYMTMGCSPQVVPPGSEACSAEKFATIDKLFASETIDGQPIGNRNISNLDIGNSGLFLSGLYGKRPDLMAQAVQQGQNLNLADMKGSSSSATPQDKENLKKVARNYWKSRTAPVFERLEANAFLFFAFGVYGEQLNPIKDTVTGIMPVGKDFSKQAAQDWNHLTDFLHHKLLLVDRKHLQMGGRNIEDSYHMHPNQLARKYLFMDTDLYAELNQGGEQIATAFDELWNFTPMVARLDEVRKHAPNDIQANQQAMSKAEEACSDQKEQTARIECIGEKFSAFYKNIDQRMSDQSQEMNDNSRRYRMEYLPTVVAQPAAIFPVDSSAVLIYFENTPFNRTLPLPERTRTYGALAGNEAEAGKNITAFWLQTLPEVCGKATPTEPAQIILHNAYFFPPANLTYGLSLLADGQVDCSNVTVTVLTNSIETTDLNVVNLAARQSLKAFSEFYQQHSDPARRAKFEYWEYQPQPGKASLSLHSKVTVLGNDIMIGSANADVRSFFMDSNNAMLVSSAPELMNNYRAFIKQILDEPGRAKKLNDYFATTPRETILQEDLAVFRQILSKYHVDKKLSEDQMKQVEGRFVQMLNDVYRLTVDSLNPATSNASKRKQQDDFNNQFKPI